MIKIEPKNSFNKASKTYQKYSFLQQKIARKLAESIKEFDFYSMIDLGCGSGAIYNALAKKPDRFVGVDFSKELLKEHPRAKNIELLEMDFESECFFNYLKMVNKFDITISSCALQWCKNPSRLFRAIFEKSSNFLFAIVADTTFNTIHKKLNIKSPLISTKELLKSIPSYNFLKKESFLIPFETPKEALIYIKNSGVSGGVKLSNIGNLKRFIKENQKVELNFDVIYISSIKNLRINV